MNPLLVVIELDYTSSQNSQRPFQMRILELKEVCAKMGYTDLQISRIMFAIVVEGKRLYSVQYPVSNESAFVVWTIPATDIS